MHHANSKNGMDYCLRLPVNRSKGFKQIVEPRNPMPILFLSTSEFLLVSKQTQALDSDLAPLQNNRMRLSSVTSVGRRMATVQRRSNLVG